MTTVAVTRATTSRISKARNRKPTARQVALLKSALVQVQEELTNTRKAAASQVLGLQELVNNRNDELLQKNEALTEAQNERDAIRRDLDTTRRLAQRDCDRLSFNGAELLKDLRRLREAHTDLTERNRVNFDKARRNTDVAAVLASMLAATNTPADIVLKFVEAAQQMGISPEVFENVQTALKRGYVAQVEQVVSDMVARQSPDLATGPDITDSELREIIEDIKRRNEEEEKLFNIL